MPQFRYRAVSAAGTPVKGVVEAVSASGLENELLIQGHEAIQVKEKKGFSQIEITAERVPPQEIMHFSRQLSAFSRTGIPINDAIRVVGDGVTNKRLRAILVEVEEDLQAGASFSNALQRHSSIFPPYYISILRSAELTGRLDVVLDQLSAYIERDLDARSKVKSALTYPAVVMVMAIVTVLVMVLFVLPRFVVFFDSLDSELPITTRMLIGLADFSGQWWWAILLTIGLIGGGLYATGKSPGGVAWRHRTLLRMPLIGDIVRYSTIERFCRVLAAMMKAGVPLPSAMSAAMESANNKAFEPGLLQAREEMIQGDGIAGPLGRSDLFPGAAVQMFRVGEETGTLDEQAEVAADFYNRELDFRLKRLTTVFEPAVIIFMGGIVGFVAVALISAMYGVLQGIDQDQL